MSVSDRTRVTTGVVLEPASEIQLSYVLAKTYKAGPCLGGSDTAMTREMFATTVNSLSRILKLEGSPLRIGIESTGRYGRDCKGLIVYTGGKTHVIPVTVSAFLVRIGGEPVFVGHEDGATDLLDRIIDRIEDALEAEKAGD